MHIKEQNLINGQHIERMKINKEENDEMYQLRSWFALRNDTT